MLGFGFSESELSSLYFKAVGAFSTEECSPKESLRKLV
jgi:hypothetical protein